MSSSIYQRPNKKWKADVELNSVRATKTFERKEDVVRWAKEKERDLLLNEATQRALKKSIVMTMREALNRYAEEVSRYKSTGKKEIQRIHYFQNNLPNIDWPLVKYKGEFLKQWEDAVTKRSVKPLKPASVLRDYSTLSVFFNWCRKVMP